MSGVNKYLIFATDTAALALMRERGYHAWDGRSLVGKGLDSKDAQFRSKQWKSLTQAKLRVADKAGAYIRLLFGSIPEPFRRRNHPTYPIDSAYVELKSGRLHAPGTRCCAPATTCSSPTSTSAGAPPLCTLHSREQCTLAKRCFR